MVCERKCAVFLLVIAAFSSVNSLPVDDLVSVGSFISDMGATVEITTEIPVVVELVREIETTEKPAKEKIQALSFILDSLKVVNDKALSFVQTYITDLELEDDAKPQVSMDTPQTPQKNKKKTVKHPILHHFLNPASPNSLQSAFTKYKGALQNIATKVKTIPASIISHFIDDEILQDPVDTATSADMTLKPAETPMAPASSETPVKVSVPEDVQKPDANIEEKPNETPEKKPEEKPDVEPVKVEARKLGSSNIAAWPDTDTKESREIVETVKAVVEATKRVNEDAFDLVQAYLNRLTDDARNIDENSEIDRSLDSSAVEVEQNVDELCLEKIDRDPEKIVVDRPNDKISSASNEKNINYAQSGSPIYNLTVQFFSFLNSIIPRTVGREIANRLRQGAEGLVRSFSNKRNES